MFVPDACKKAILETIENTDSRKEMVLRLIQLRIRFEDMKERADHASNINKMTPLIANFSCKNSASKGYEICGLKNFSPSSSKRVVFEKLFLV